MHPKDDQAFWAWDSSEDLARSQALFRAIEVLTWFVGLVTLAAATIGVGNVMTVSIRERRHEFALRRAVGATPRIVVTQVVIESFALVGLAGAAGLTCGVLMLDAIEQHLAHLPLAERPGLLDAPGSPAWILADTTSRAAEARAWGATLAKGRNPEGQSEPNQNQERKDQGDHVESRLKRRDQDSQRKP